MASLNETLIRELLIAIGENPDREGLIDTPKRVVKSWDTIFGGYKQKPENGAVVSIKIPQEGWI